MISGSQPEPGGQTVQPTTSISLFDELFGDGDCQMVGMQFQLDIGKPIAPFLGKPLDVKVALADKAGRRHDITARAVVDSGPFCQPQ